MSLLRRALGHINKMVEESDNARRKREHEAADARASEGTCTDDGLIYAAYSRCSCGAGLAYPRGIGPLGYWDCSDILTGRAAPKGAPNSKLHAGILPFTFYEVKSEQQPSANGATTRKAA